MDAQTFTLAVVSSWALQFVMYHGCRLAVRLYNYEKDFRTKTETMVNNTEEKLAKLEKDIKEKITVETNKLNQDNRAFLSQCLAEFKSKTSDGYKTCLGLMADSNQAEIVDRMISHHENLSQHYMNVIDVSMRDRVEKCTVPSGSQAINNTAFTAIRNIEEEKKKNKKTLVEEIEEFKENRKAFSELDDLNGYETVSFSDHLPKIELKQIHTK